MIFRYPRVFLIFLKFDQVVNSQKWLKLAPPLPIAENWSARHDESALIQKSKLMGTTYEKCARLLQKQFNVTYSVFLLLRGRECWLHTPGAL